MTSRLTNFIHRMQLEQGYALLADVDEDRLALPDESRWREKFRKLEEQLDIDKIDDALDGYFAEVERHHETWKPAGGAFECPLDGGATGGGALFAEPALLELKPYFSRILVKLTPFALRVLLIAENHVPDGISRARLLEIGSRLRAQYGEGSEAPADEAPRKRKRKRREIPFSVVFELLVLGERVIRPAACQRLGRLKKRFSPRQHVFIYGHLLDTAGKRLWSNLPRLFWVQRRDLAYALRHSEQNAASIRREIDSSKVSAAMVAFMVVLAFALLIGGTYLLGRVFDGELIGLWALFAPLIAIVIGISLTRRKHTVDKQVSYFLWIYLSGFVGLVLLIVWPPGFTLAAGLLMTSVMVYTIGRLIGVLAQVE